MHKLTRILFVDGRSKKHPQLVRTFRQSFDDVVEAADYDDALQQLKRRRFDVLFTGEWPDSTNALALLRAARERDVALSYFVHDAVRGTESVVTAVPVDHDEIVVRAIDGETPDDWVNSSLQHLREVRVRHDGLKYLRNVFCSTEEALIFIGHEGRIVDMNQAASSLLGLKPGAFQGLKFADVVGRTEPGFEEVLRRCRESGNRVTLEPVRLRGTGGAPIAAAARLRALRASTGDCEGLLMWVRPIQAGFGDLLHDRPTQAEELTGASPGMRQALAELERAGRQDRPVLIIGEPGTGKRVAAREIHLHSQRGKTGPFVVVHCASVPEPLLEGVLFGGHAEHGAGRIAEASGGTLVLEEISQLTPRLQDRLLKAMESGLLDSARGERIPFNVRLIATCRRPLVEPVARAEFSEALYELLRSVEIDLPPLRERRDDIPFLVEKLRPRLNDHLFLGIQRIDDEAMQLLMAYSWSGNVTQLEQVLERAFVACGASIVQAGHLPIEVREGNGPGNNARRARDDAQREELIDVLNWAGWNKSKAARKLGISRETLYRRMEKFELEDRQEA